MHTEVVYALQKEQEMSDPCLKLCMVLPGGSFSLCINYYN